MKPKVLVAEKVHEILFQKMGEMGYDCDYFPEISQEEVLKKIGDYEGIIIRGKLKLDKLFFESAKQLRFVGRPGSGLENVDLDAASSKKIIVINSPEGNANAVAEHALTMLLSVMKFVHRADDEMRNFIFERERNRAYELSGKTIALIGYGNTGKAFEQILQGFAMNFLCNDIDANKLNDKQNISLQEIAERADIISFHVSMNPISNGMFSKSFIEKLKQKPIIINTSRGKVIPMHNLLYAFQSEKISAACIDVFENEEFSSLSDSERQLLNILMQQKVLFTPHIAGWTHEALYKMSAILVEKLRDKLKN